MEWKEALMAYLIQSFCRTSFFLFLSPDAHGSFGIHSRFYQVHRWKVERVQKNKQELYKLSSYGIIIAMYRLAKNINTILVTNYGIL
jgi:hypothetical protein